MFNNLDSYNYFNVLKNTDILSSFLSQSQIAEVENNKLFILYFNLLTSYALTQFEWTNLPDNLKHNERWIELVFTFSTSGLITYKNEFEKPLFLQALPTGDIDIYSNYTHFEGKGANGYSITLNDEECVVGYDNYLRIPIIPQIIYEYAKRLADVQRTLDVRLNNHKRPIIYTGNRKSSNALKTLFKKIVNNEPNFIIDESLEVRNGLNILTNDVSNMQKELFSYKKDLWNEAMLMLGFDNANTDKKERQIVDEVHANDNQVMMSRQIRLKARKDFCRLVNEKYGLDIDVNFNDFIDNNVSYFNNYNDTNINEEVI